MLAVITVFALVASAAFAQEAPPKERSVYRLDITIKDGENTTKGNALKYSMVVEDGGSARVNTGGRVPYATGSFQPGQGNSPLVATQFNFMEVGINLRCTVREVADRVWLKLEVDVTDTNSPPNPEKPSPMPPVLNRHQAGVETQIAPGKPAVVLTWDEPSGKRRYEVEVAATKLR
jgi:hypothetical protein